MKLVELTAPAFLASYLINNDASGIEPEEKEACDKWLEAEGLDFPVSIVEEDPFWPKYGWHEAKRFFPLLCDCLTYQFLTE